MKTLAIFISLNLFLTGITWCYGSFTISDEVSYNVDTVIPEKSIPSCCQSGGKDKQGPQNNEPCQDGCSCYCCSVVVAIAVRHIPTVFLQENVRPQRWQISTYAHDFTHMIWQPPKIS